jgi:hypothetical protein
MAQAVVKMWERAANVNECECITPSSGVNCGPVSYSTSHGNSLSPTKTEAGKFDLVDEVLLVVRIGFKATDFNVAIRALPFPL